MASPSGLKPHPALVPVTLGAIVVLAFVSVGMPWAMTDPPIDDSSVQIVLFGVLLVVAISELFVNRLAVFQTQFNVVVAETPLPPERTEQVVSTMYALSAAFSVASSIYGVAFAVITHQGWYALVFSAIALLTWFVLHSYVKERAADLRTRLGAQVT